MTPTETESTLLSGKDILVISTGLFHPNLRSRLSFFSLLKHLIGYKFHFSTSTEDLCLLKGGKYKSVVLYLHQTPISKTAMQHLEVFLLKGGGLLLLHSSTSSFVTYPKYMNIIGGRYLIHDTTEELTILPATKVQESPFKQKKFSLRDAICHHELYGDITPYFIVKRNNEEIPVIWSTGFYLGRVMICSLGHHFEVFKTPEMYSILVDSLEWVSSQPA